VKAAAGANPAYRPTDKIRHVFVVPILFAATGFTGRHATGERELAMRADENENVVAAINRLRCARGAPETNLAEIVDGNLGSGPAAQSPHVARLVAA
jgi:hypothetical protein